MQSIVQPTAMNTNENMLVCGEPDRDVDMRLGLICAISQLRPVQ
jgi:hypothetical protein